MHCFLWHMIKKIRFDGLLWWLDEDGVSTFYIVIRIGSGSKRLVMLVCTFAPRDRDMKVPLKRKKLTT